ncbi:hypothetical protein M409DRAFT_68531 [Zasmidium cellare ATCC 36951]|uniref:Uncharacterized protein n=1 Tax=Zasmidium cellare ATCC 36951 TaxID=1080233 RepID=A0A6A6C833_ZASCE|nr:uncharacterized protein M409DRAFT_68531 [Zasmidium cellare ATCC 36951]KAF2163215.1 hypothetical protein M409DRAFT_68531 [Zasmidium cellare ATCC 36951]
MENISRFFQQCFFLPQPTLTEQNLPDQFGRVFIVTGGYAGVGSALAKILYSKNGIVYIAGRNAEKADVAIRNIQKAHPLSKGKLYFLKLDLADLSTIKASTEDFLSKESRLDVLVNNAGVMNSPVDSVTAQEHELQLGTNCLAHFLLTCQLTPILERTAANSGPASVRVIWAASLEIENSPAGGVPFNEYGNPEVHKSNTFSNYTASKVGDYFLASQFARLHRIQESAKGVVSLAFNPGNLHTDLQRHSSSALVWILDKLMLFPAVFGAYTELWAGWSDCIKPEDSGKYIWPWGRFGEARQDIQAQLEFGGNAEFFWDWCLREVKPYL